tara:strand:+ start:3384 stop:3602 length:219 start_codon:yes stop_codon:yes gene_type:complete
MNQKINHISSTKDSITISNGRNFIVSQGDKEKLKKWREGDSVKFKKHTSENPYSYQITNLTNGDVCFFAHGE